MERSVRRNSLKGFRSGLRSLRPVMILILISIKLKIKTLNAVNVEICNGISPLGDLGLLHQDKPTSCTSSAAFGNASIVERQSKSSAPGGNRSSCFLSVAPAASEQQSCRRFHSGLHVGDSGCFSRRVTHAINWRLARAAAPAFTLTSWHVAPCKNLECRRGKMEVDGWILFIRENTSHPECCNVRRECAEFWEREGISPRVTAAPPSPARRQLELTWQPARKRASE